MTKNIPYTDRTPQAIFDAERAVEHADAAVRNAKSDLAAAEQACAGAADADADAVLAAAEAGKPVPSKLPSEKLAATLATARRTLDARQTLHGRAVEALAETYRTEAGGWHAAELAVAEEAEAECLAALAKLVETFDRAREARAVAEWVGSTRAGAPMQPFTGAERPSGGELLVGRVRNVLGVEARELAAQARRERQAATAREAEAERAEVDRQADAVRRQAEHEAGEVRARQSIEASLAAGGFLPPQPTPAQARGLTKTSAAALGELLAVKTSPDVDSFFEEPVGADHA